MQHQSKDRPCLSLHVSWTTLRAAALTYALLPVLVFVVGWLRLEVRLVSLAALAFVWLWSSVSAFRGRFPLWSTRSDILLRDQKADLSALNVPMAALAVFLVASSLWVLFSGIGGFWAQSTDFSARNSIYQTLVLESWPVYFDDGASSLVYYLNHWLPPAAMGKVALMLFGEPGVAMMCANVSLYLWSVLGVLLALLLFVHYLRVSTLRAGVIAALVLVLFSGLDIVGVISRCLMGSADVANHVFGIMHLDQWPASSSVQFSSNTTLLFWVFNQTIIPWICTMCVLIEDGPSRYVPFVLASFGAGPYPTMGLALICVTLGIQGLVRAARNGRGLDFLRSALSPSNVVSVPIAFLYVFFFLGNQSVSTSGERMQLLGLAPGATVRLVFLFYLVEVGFYAALLFGRFRTLPLYWLSVVILAVLPFVHFGSWYEVCYRVSIPFLLVLCLLCARMLIDGLSELPEATVRDALPTLLLIAALIVGAVTPAFEFARGAVSVSRNGIEGSLQPAADIAGSTVEDGAQNNFKAPISDGSIFFTYLAEPYEGN